MNGLRNELDDGWSSNIANISTFVLTRLCCKTVPQMMNDDVYNLCLAPIHSISYALSVPLRIESESTLGIFIK